ncbi:MAG: SET domain-containing protein [Xanthobacteraceae bacterium]
MTASSHKPFRVGRSRTGLGLFATKEISKGEVIVEYLGRMLDCRIKAHDDIENKYLFELNSRWTIDGSSRKNLARYGNHSCRPNAESDVQPRNRRVFIRAIKTIRPGDEITYDYGKDYFDSYLKPIGCKCPSCEKKRAAARAEARAAKKSAKARAEKRAQKHAGRKADTPKAKTSKAKTSKAKASKAKTSKAKTSKAKTSAGKRKSG